MAQRHARRAPIVHAPSGQGHQCDTRQQTLGLACLLHLSGSVNVFDTYFQISEACLTARGRIALYPSVLDGKTRLTQPSTLPCTYNRFNRALAETEVSQQRNICFHQRCQRRETCQKIRGLDGKRIPLSQPARHHGGSEMDQRLDAGVSDEEGRGSLRRIECAAL